MWNNELGSFWTDVGSLVEVVWCFGKGIWFLEMVIPSYT